MNEDDPNQMQAPKSCVWDGIVASDRPSRQTLYCKSNVNHTARQDTPKINSNQTEAAKAHPETKSAI